MNRTALTILVFSVVATAAGPAAAGTRWFAYQAEGQTTRYRTGDVTLELRTPMLFGASRVVSLWRRRGSDLPLDGPSGQFRPDQIAAAVGGSAEGLTLYPINQEAGRGFSQGSCVGATRAWVAMPEPRPYRPLRIHVLRQGASGAPELCETLEYSWRAEWTLPPRNFIPDDAGAQRPVDPAGRAN